MRTCYRYQNPQMLKSCSQPSTSLVPHLRIQLIPDHVVLHLLKRPHLSGPAEFKSVLFKGSAVYAPNMRALKYVKQILTDIKGETDSSAVIVGDFNTPLSTVHRSSRQKISKETLH